MEILPFSAAFSSAIYNGSWQLTTDSLIRAQYLIFDLAGFLIFVLVFVSHDFELDTKVSCEESGANLSSFQLLLEQPSFDAEHRFGHVNQNSPRSHRGL